MVGLSGDLSGGGAVLAEISIFVFALSGIYVTVYIFQ